MLKKNWNSPKIDSVFLIRLCTYLFPYSIFCQFLLSLHFFSSSLMYICNITLSAGLNFVWNALDHCRSFPLQSLVAHYPLLHMFSPLSVPLNHVRLDFSPLRLKKHQSLLSVRVASYSLKCEVLSAHLPAVHFLILFADLSSPSPQLAFLTFLPYTWQSLSRSLNQLTFHQ